MTGTSLTTHGDVAVGATGEAGVHSSAERRLALLAVAATPVGDVERHHDAVALFEQGHAGPNLVYYAHVLVAEGDAGLGTRAAFVHVEVTATNRGGGDFDDDVVWVLELGHWYFFDLHLECPLVVHRLHRGGLGRHLGAVDGRFTAGYSLCGQRVGGWMRFRINRQTGDLLALVRTVITIQELTQSSLDEETVMALLISTTNVRKDVTFVSPSFHRPCRVLTTTNPPSPISP